MKIFIASFVLFSLASLIVIFQNEFSIIGAVTMLLIVLSAGFWHLTMERQARTIKIYKELIRESYTQVRFVPKLK